MTEKKEKVMTQVVVWEGTIIGKDDVPKFEGWFLETFGVDVKYLEEVKTLPDKEYGREVEGTGGRNDVFFLVDQNADHFGQFCMDRMAYGMRWLEDILGNKHGDIYPKEILEKYPPTWNFDNINSPEGNWKEVYEHLNKRLN